ncbi:hypothetical protein DFQ09_105199 [Winogradskyella pacifica]|uniref:Uncharacterized protein n=1 Tax=Winogradskyella pacifica TaxID=664642 RepID=A0A3D9MD36_9FLAO|nr:hypothetical protein [Winogradskyella pacifica]REE16986.1 hypothetical protein DFQ09_105199 [Winogradskyella pacifica]
MKEITLTAATKTDLENEIVKHHSFGFKPIEDVTTNKDGMFQIKMVKHDRI